MAKKIVMKISIENEKDKKNVLKAVAKLEGINELSVDIEKGTLTILGDVDPVCIVTVLRKKCCRYVEIQTIGPAKTEEKKDEKKEPLKCPITYCPPPPCLRQCTGYPCTCDYGSDPRVCTIS